MFKLRQMRNMLLSLISGVNLPAFLMNDVLKHKYALLRSSSLILQKILYTTLGLLLIRKRRK